MSLSAGSVPPPHEGSIPSFPLVSPRDADSEEHETASGGGSRTSWSTSVGGKLDDTPSIDILPPDIRHPPRPSDLSNEPATSPKVSRETSPSRLSTLASPLARITSVKRARSQTSPMGFAGDTQSGPVQRPSATNLLAAIFKTPETTSRGSAEKKGGLFGSGFPSSPTQPPRAFRTTPISTDVIDEFAGLSFTAVLQSFLEEPISGTPISPAEALKRTPEGRLEDAVATATDLLDRVYTAYRARTASLGDMIGELEVQGEDIASHKFLNDNLKTQLDRIITEERDLQAAQAIRLEEQQRRITELEAELSRERRKREAADEELRLAPRRNNRCKRTSAASDSGFESDVDSILSRSDARASSVVSPTEEVDEPDTDHDCESCRRQKEGGAGAAVGAETKNPTPLREAWSPDTATAKPGVWGFFKGRQQAGHNDVQNVRNENRWLRERVREMERAVDSALEAVAGRGI